MDSSEHNNLTTPLIFEFFNGQRIHFQLFGSSSKKSEYVG